MSTDYLGNLETYGKKVGTEKQELPKYGPKLLFVKIKIILRSYEHMFAKIYAFVVRNYKYNFPLLQGKLIAQNGHQCEVIQL
eukprot:XP_001708825.1 Hypothetical protein GL50803_103249 [Giardia lamblia ATCC 50803]